jgi:glycosyltransferase involved in cell wall biosynthesis
MRILIVTGEWFPDWRGGAARVAADTANLLGQRGHEVVVLGPKSCEPTIEVSDGVEVRRILTRTWPRTITDPFDVMRRTSTLRASQFDVVVAHNAATTVGLRAARVPWPVVRVFHASGLRELRFLRSRLPIGRDRVLTYLREPPLALLLRIAARSATRTLVLSEFTRAVFETEAPRQAHTVRRVSGGVDTKLFVPSDGLLAPRRRLGVDCTGRLLLTVRRLVPRMGLEELLHAMAQVPASSDFQLAIVGTGMLDERLRRLSRSLGLNGRVLLVGSVSDSELREWYRAADLFVLPTQAEEGFGMVTAEALASGTPVIGTPVGATPELLRPLDSRLVAHGSDPVALSVAIQLGFQLGTQEFRVRCREYACEHLAWERVIPAWERALAEAALEGAGGSRANHGSYDC